MEILKSWSLLCDKILLKQVIHKKQQIFGLCHFFRKNCSFLKINRLRGILSLSYDQLFEISIKLKIFYAHKVIFLREKISDQIKHFFINAINFVVSQ